MPRVLHQGGHEAEPAAGLDVEPAVADQRRAGEIDPELVPSPFEELGAGLSARAAAIRVMRAEVERVDPRPAASEQLVEPGVDALDILARVEPPLDAGLVGHADDQLPVVMDQAHGVGDATEQLEPGGVLEVARVRVEGPVAIDEERTTSACRGAGRLLGGGDHELEEGVAPLTVRPCSTRPGGDGVDGRPLDPERSLARALEEILRPWKASAEAFTLLFSGGIDSGLLAWELRGSPGLVALTVGRPGAADLVAAEASAALLGIRWVGRTVDEPELRRLRERWTGELEAMPRPLRGVVLALALGLEAAPTSRVLCGQGADELFLGYAHFREMDPVSARRRAESDLRQLLEIDWPRTERIARQLGREILAPYLDPRFRRAAEAIPIEKLLPRPEAKAWFRQWAAGRGLPGAIARRPKRALQYGSGIARWLRDDARRGSPSTEQPR